MFQSKLISRQDNLSVGWYNWKLVGPLPLQWHVEEREINPISAKGDTADASYPMPLDCNPTRNDAMDEPKTEIDNFYGFEVEEGAIKFSEQN